MLPLQDVNGTLTKQYSSIHHIQKQSGMGKSLANSFNNGEKIKLTNALSIKFHIKSKIKNNNNFGW